MGNLSQNLKAVITFGGNLDSSWKRSAADLNKNLKEVSRQSATLTQQQKKLAGEIKKTTLSGQKLGDLKRRYRDISGEIRRTETEQKKLNAQMQKTQRLARFTGRGKGLLRRGVSLAGQMAGNILPISGFGGGLVASAAGALLSPMTTNSQTAGRANLAKSFGVSVPVFDRWDSLTRPYGMGGESVGSLYSNYRKKAGEYKQTGKQVSLQKAFQTLGFGAGDFAGLTDLEQFSKILERALTLPDQSKASFAMTTLMGNEAGKLLTLMKQSGKSYRDLMDEQARYNLVTEQGAEGAVAGYKAMTDLQTLFSSALAEVSGQLGRELAPEIRKLSADLSDWFRNGGLTKITAFLKRDLYPGVLTFGQGILLVGKVVWALAQKLSWLLPDEAAEKEAMIRSTGVGEPLLLAKRRAEKSGLTEWYNARLGTPEQREAVRRQWQQAEEKAGFWTSRLPGEFQSTTSRNILATLEGTDSSEAGAIPTATTPSVTTSTKKAPSGSTSGVWEKLTSDLLSSQPTRGAVTDNRRFEFSIEVNAAPGQNPASIADEVIQRARENMLFNGNNNLTDGGSPW